MTFYVFYVPLENLMSLENFPKENYWKHKKS